VKRWARKGKKRRREGVGKKGLQEKHVPVIKSTYNRFRRGATGRRIVSARGEGGTGRSQNADSVVPENNQSGCNGQGTVKVVKKR